MRRLLLAALAVVSLGAVIGYAANYTATQGAGTTFFSFTNAAVNLPGVAILDSTGTNAASVTASNAVKVDLSSTAANATAVKVDGSAVTQPVSGTVTATGNTTQLGGNAINLGTGATGSGTQRTVTASDSPEIAILNTISTNTGASLPPAPAGSGNVLTGTSCGSAVSSCVLKASAGNLYGVYAECTSACWLMVFNATSLPANGATTAGNASGNLVECIDVAAGSSRSLTYPVFPRALTVGITVAISSTACATLTASTVGFVSGTVM